MTPRLRPPTLLGAVTAALTATLVALPTAAGAAPSPTPTPSPSQVPPSYALDKAEVTIGDTVRVTVHARPGDSLRLSDGESGGLTGTADQTGTYVFSYVASNIVNLSVTNFTGSGTVPPDPASPGAHNADGSTVLGVHGRPVLQLLSRPTLPAWRAISMKLDELAGGPYYDPQLLEASVNDGPWSVVGSTNQLTIPPEGGSLRQNTDTPALVTAVATRAGIWRFRLHDPGSKDLLDTVGAPVTLRIKARKAPGWLSALNKYRSQAGSLPVGEDPVLSAHDLVHARWMAKHRIIEHGEQGPGATPAGDDAGKHSDLILGSVPLGGPAAVLEWMRAPFHALCLLNPALQAAGFGAYGGAEALDCLSRLGAIAPASLLDPAAQGWPRMWPNSATKLATKLNLFAGEIPDPTVGCRGMTRTPGLPMLVSFGAVGAPGSVAADLTAPVVSLTDQGHRVAACVRTQYSFPTFTTASLSLAAMQTVLVIPTKPLKRGHTYKLVVTAGTAVAQDRITVATGP